MAYNSVALQQMQGQELMNALGIAHEAFRKRNEYQYAVNDQYRRLTGLEEHKGYWTLTHAVRHPAKWVIVATATLGALIVWGHMMKIEIGALFTVLFAGCLIALSFVGFAMAYAIQASFVEKCLEGKIKKHADKVGFGLLSMMLVTAVILTIGGMSWYVILYGMMGIYTALCWIDIKIVNRKQHKRKKKQHFQKQDEEMALELSWRLKRLQDFCASETMQFAEALVPQEFQSSQELGALMLVMKKYAVYDLHSAIRDYYQEKHMEQMEAEAAAARRAQEQMLQEQRAQTEILEWQRRDNHWHNKEMEYQQQRQNETLNDMKREQKEYHDRIKHYMDGYRY